MLCRCLCIIMLATTIASGKVIVTSNGPVKGVTVFSTKTSRVKAFFGIPFAEPPIGDLRFKPPVPKSSWTHVYEATTPSPTCIQNVTQKIYFLPDITNMTEDCLYLNMWVPFSKKASDAPKPILLYIHGGTFRNGAANMELYDGARLASFGDVLVVTVNYRLGAFGFFAAFTDEANGNMGLKDLIMATEWVKTNARFFGGDPDNIVLVGQSSGSMIISIFLSSPLTNNLFKRVIMQSGAAAHPIFLDHNARLGMTSQKFSGYLGCADGNTTVENNPKAVVECLKQLPAPKLAEAEGLLALEAMMTFFPRIGDDVVPLSSIYSLKKGRFYNKEILIGVNAEEGNIFLTLNIPSYFGVLGHGNVKSINKRQAEQITSLIFKATEQTDSESIIEFYIGSIDNGTSDDFTEAIGKSVGDYVIACSTFFTAQFYSLRNPVYFYVFSRKPSSTVLADWVTPTHIDELQYVFGNPIFDNFTEGEIVLSEKMMRRWISFAKTGNPNIPDEIVWPAMSYDYPVYLEINDEDSIRLRPENRRCEFWRDRFRAHPKKNDMANKN